MAGTERFNTFAELEAEKLRLLALRTHHEHRLQQHWDALRDREVRGALMSDAASDILRSWKPFRVLASLFGKGNGNGDGAFAALMFGAAISGGSWGRRMFRLALNLALPALLKRAGSISFETVAHEIQVTMERMREHFRARKEKHARYEEEDDE